MQRAFHMLRHLLHHPASWCQNLSQSTQAALTKYHRLRLKQTFLSHSSGDWDVQDRGTRIFTSTFQPFFLALKWPPPQGTILRTSSESNHHHPPTPPLPNTITWDGGWLEHQSMNLVWDTHYPYTFYAIDRRLGEIRFLLPKI